MTSNEVTKKSVSAVLRGLRQQHPYSDPELTAAIQWIDKWVPDDIVFEQKKSRLH